MTIKSIPLILFAVSSHLLCAAQTDKQKLDSAKALVKNGQIVSALSTINSCKEFSPEITHFLVTIFLEHAAAYNQSYNKFRMENKSPGQASYTEQVDFPLEQVVMSAINQYPGDCNFRKDITAFYQKILVSEDMYISLSTLDIIAKNTRDYSTDKCPDYLAYYIIGYCNNYLGHPDSSKVYLQKSIALNQEFAAAYLQLAEVFLTTKNYQAALNNAKKASDLSNTNKDYKKNKSKAALLQASAYEALNDNNNALACYILADSLYRKDFFNLKALLTFYVKTNNSKASEKLNTFLGSQGRDNLHNYIDVLQIYRRYNRETDLAAYCESAMAQYDQRPGILSCLNFTLGKIYQKINIAIAKQYFLKAKEQGITAERYQATRNHPSTEKEIEAAFKLLN